MNLLLHFENEHRNNTEQCLLKQNELLRQQNSQQKLNLFRQTNLTNCKTFFCRISILHRSIGGEKKRKRKYLYKTKTYYRNLFLVEFTL